MELIIITVYSLDNHKCITTKILYEEQQKVTHWRDSLFVEETVWIF